ncbi:hypothetical protein AVEN_48263-1 [Araneus ventricosus]|uniref:Uncharacterized protein n=1 Tax=Araneus ventricosus TaxID=182803 RepID=A0A4Y2ELS6_ARAVE|nr:hypothetical protein AVEN_48263-1 [Araneus ventricosus]
MLHSVQQEWQSNPSRCALWQQEGKMSLMIRIIIQQPSIIRHLSSSSNDPPWDSTMYGDRCWNWVLSSGSSKSKDLYGSLCNLKSVIHKHSASRKSDHSTPKSTFNVETGQNWRGAEDWISSPTEFPSLHAIWNGRCGLIAEMSVEMRLE